VPVFTALELLLKRALTISSRLLAKFTFVGISPTSFSCTVIELGATEEAEIV
jgi:hypothetical protein